MALTIDVQPIALTPACNQMTFRVISTNVGETEYKYIFDLYVDGVFVSRSKFYPRPDNYANFDISKIIQNYLSAKFINELTSGAYSDTSLSCTYYVNFKEEYEVTGTLTEFNISNSATKNTWLAVADWNASKNLTNYVNQFLPNGSTSVNTLDSLTFIPDISILYPKYTQKVNPTDKRVISIMPRDLSNGNKPTRLKVKTWCANGNNKTFTKNITFNSTADPLNQIYHQPVGIAELNSISWTSTSIPGGLSSTITEDEDNYYYVWFENASYQTHKAIGFEINSCEKYDKYTVLYQTSNGGWWYVPMSMKNYQSENIEKQSYQVYLPSAVDNQTRTTVVSHIQVSKTYELNSDWINLQTKVDEITDMLHSPLVYLIDSLGNYIPVTPQNASYKIDNVNQNKQVFYNIQFIVATQNNYLK